MKTRNKFIEELMQTAQENIWKNELVIAYYETGLDSGSTTGTPLNISATEEVIKRDKAYIKFLKNESSK